MMRTRSGGFFMVCFIILGVIAVLVGVTAATNGSSITPAISWTISIVAFILFFWAGRAAKQSGAHPVGRGALLGTIFGFIRGLSFFFMHVNMDTVQNKVHGSIPTDTLQKTVDLMNSPIAHVLSLIIMIIAWGVLGLIFAFVGGATVKVKRD
jgi:hypothetical protein